MVLPEVQYCWEHLAFTPQLLLETKPGDACCFTQTKSVCCNAFPDSPGLYFLLQCVLILFQLCWSALPQGKWTMLMLETGAKCGLLTVGLTPAGTQLELQ